MHSLDDILAHYLDSEDYARLKRYLKRSPVGQSFRYADCWGGIGAILDKYESAAGGDIREVGARFGYLKHI